MADSYVRVPADSTGKKVDAASLDVGADTVYRQRIVIADNSATATFATVTGGALMVTGNVNLSATASVVIATPVPVNNISATVQVAIGTPFTVNNISATVTVAGSVALTGTATVAFGSPQVVNNISATVIVAISTPFTIQAISTTVSVAGNVNLSATAAVGLAYVTEFSTGSQVKVGDSANQALRVNIVAGGGSGGTSMTDGTSFTSQAAPFTPIGGIFDDTSPDLLSENDAGVVRLTQSRAIHANIRHSNGNEVSTASALPVHVVNGTTTSTVVIGAGAFTIGTVVSIAGPIAIMSASHGPKCVTASTSANVTLIASPGTGLSIHVTSIMVGNASATLTKARIGTSASTGTIIQPIAASGGGFVLNFDPPWKLSASEAALCSVKPNVSEVYFTVNYYVAA